MFDIGFWEIMLIAVVALIVVGPERLPRVIRVAGLWVGKANASIQSVRREISRELHAEELRQAINKPQDIPIVREILSPDTTPKSSSEKPKQDTNKEQEKVIDGDR
jgi:sec-independent protein translocase protein TatB